jgi:hypothetical protein
MKEIEYPYYRNSIIIANIIFPIGVSLGSLTLLRLKELNEKRSQNILLISFSISLLKILKIQSNLFQIELLYEYFPYIVTLFTIIIIFIALLFGSSNNKNR